MAKYVRTEEGYKDLIGIYNEIRSTPDWSDNNELSPNYIKNRTHYDPRELLWLVGNEDALETITLDRTFYDGGNSSTGTRRGVSLHIIDNVNINTADKPVAQITYYDNNGQLRTYKVNLPIEDHYAYNNNWVYSDNLGYGHIPFVNIDGCILDLVYYTISHTLTVGLNFDDNLPRTSMILSLCIITGGELVQLADKYISQNIARTKDVIAKTNEIEYIPTENYHPATKKYVDDTATTAANAIKNDLLNGAGEAYNTLKELGELIDENQDAIEALEIIATGKANVSDIPTKVSQLANDSGYITEAPQSDWNQTDETALDFIKNKPDESDALALLAEVGFVEPIADADGSIYTDENGNIYTLI